MHMGLPQVIISDQGREFNNELDTSLAEQLGIKRRLTTPYHPQVGTCSYMQTFDIYKYCKVHIIL